MRDSDDAVRAGRVATSDAGRRSRRGRRTHVPQPDRRVNVRERLVLHRVVDGEDDPIHAVRPRDGTAAVHDVEVRLGVLAHVGVGGGRRAVECRLRRAVGRGSHAGRARDPQVCGPGVVHDLELLRGRADRDDAVVLRRKEKGRGLDTLGEWTPKQSEASRQAQLRHRRRLSATTDRRQRTSLRSHLGVPDVVEDDVLGRPGGDVVAAEEAAPATRGDDGRRGRQLRGEARRRRTARREEVGGVRVVRDLPEGDHGERRAGDRGGR